MADAEVRVKVGTDTEEIKLAQKEVDKLTKQLDRVRERSEKASALGGSKKQLKSIGYDAELLEDKLAAATEQLRQLSEMPKADIGTGFEKASDSAKKFQNTVEKSVRKSNSLFKIMANRMKGITLSLLVFNWITKGFNAMVSAMREGFHNLAQYSDDYNASMSALKSECAELKNSLAVAFEPVANVIIPYLTELVEWLNVATDKIAQFLAALRGKSTYTKAKKQVVDYAKGLETASEAANGALASFDKLNVLNKKNGSVSSSGEVTGSDAFETVGVDSQYIEAANDALQALKPFKDALDKMISETDMEKLISSFTRLKEACAPFGGYLYEGLLWFWNTILIPFGGWTIGEAIPAFFDLLSAALEVLSIILNKLKPYGEWLWNEFLLPVAEWTGEKVIDGIKFLTDVLKTFSSWCKSDKKDVDLMSAEMLGLFAGIVMYYAAKSIVGKISTITKGLETFIKVISGGISPIALAAIAIGTLAAGIIYLSSNWDRLSGAQKAITILGALAAAATAAAIAVAVFHTAWSVGVAAAAIVGGLALLGLTAACLKSNGNVEGNANPSFANYDFSSSALPQLADGAVIPGGRPFAAILGDQRAGQTNIEAPLGTIEQALENVLARTNGTGEIHITLNLDGEPVFRDIVKRDRQHIKQTGHSAFAY